MSCVDHVINRATTFTLYLQARLKDNHQELLRKKLFFLKQQQLTQGGVNDSSPLFPGGLQEEDDEEEMEEREEVMEEEEEVVKSKTEGAEVPGGSDVAAATDSLIDEDELLRGALATYTAGRYSPRLIRHGDVAEVWAGSGEKGGGGGVCVWQVCVQGK